MGTGQERNPDNNWAYQQQKTGCGENMGMAELGDLVVRFDLGVVTDRY